MTNCRLCKFLKIKDDNFDYSNCPNFQQGTMRFMDESLDNDYQCSFFQQKEHVFFEILRDIIKTHSVGAKK